MPEILIKIIVCLLAGFGAGVGTGLAGLSAACVIAPMLIVFLDVDPYMAVAIALASDVLASAIGALDYGKNKHINLKADGIVLMVSVLISTILGSYLAYILKRTNSAVSSNFSIYLTVLIGLKFLVFPDKKEAGDGKDRSKAFRIIASVISGIFIGSTCGFVGAGGGMMMLLALTTLLKYDLKSAVGTSLFIMTFTALTGSITHFAFSVIDKESIDVVILICCMGFTLLFSHLSSLFANKVTTKTLNRVLGTVLVLLGVAMVTVYQIKSRDASGSSSLADLLSKIKQFLNIGL